MGVINRIVSQITSREDDRQELFKACKDGYVSLWKSEGSEKISVRFGANGIDYTKSRGYFASPNVLEMHHHMEIPCDIFYVTVEELIEHGAEDRR